MRKVIGAINMTLNGDCDHTAPEPDEDIHEHYRELLGEGGVILYGRKTFQLMTFWKTLLEKPSGEKSMDDFAKAIDKIPKIVFSKTLKSSDLDWDSATLSDMPIEEEVLKLRQKPGKDIFVGSRSLIIQLINLNLLDELQLCIYPLITTGGMPLFENIDQKTHLKLKKTKTFSAGPVILYYERA
jgi:dihydrofolate reductase